MTKIRNIIQTAMGREVIKTAPDMVVYLDGVPFVIHPYMSDKNGKPLVVNFNDYITAISTTYSLDQMVPSGSISLSIPNGSKQLFKAPGGGVILETMSEIQIFAKSYFFSKKQNTVYRRVFYGLVKSVDYNELNTSLEITIGIAGILRLFEMTKLALAPGLMSFSSTAVTPFVTNQHRLNPLQAIREVFTRAVDMSDMQRTSISEGISMAAPVKAALKHNYIEKWAFKLSSIWSHVHIFGLKNMEQDVKTSPKSTNPEEQIPTLKSNVVDKVYFGNDYQNHKIKRYTFDLAIGSISLTTPTMTTRLERLRTLVDIIGYEAYQDLDGAIIFKPPLYNLDCTILGNRTIPSLADEQLSEETNPFIIHLSEVMSENYNEDESAIRRTRMTVQGNINPNGIQISAGPFLTPVADFVDVNLVRKFGVRDEAPKTLLFLGWDNIFNYSFAAGELARINLGYRTYHVTIPMRPELRLGFPIFIPHLDMYAYITNIGLTYNVGSKADMTITCNACRKRPQFPQETTLDSGQKVVVYQSIPNLINKWCKGTNADYRGDTLKVSAQATPPSVGTPSTNFTYDPLTLDEQTVNNLLINKIGAAFGSFFPTKDTNWIIQNDSDNLFGSPMKAIDNGVSPAGKVVKTANEAYVKSTLHSQPYTDEKGYEVISPFPWGRYSSLKDALFIFTRGGLIDIDNKNQNDRDVGGRSIRGVISSVESTNYVLSTNLNSVSPFLLGGFTSPNSPPDMLVNPINFGNSSNRGTSNTAPFVGSQTATDLIKMLANSTVVSFEMDYSGSNTPNTDTSLLNKQINDILKNQTTTKFTATTDVNGVRSQTVATPSSAAQSRSATFLEGIADDLSSMLNESGYDTTYNQTGNRLSNSNNDVSLLPQTTQMGTYRANASTLGTAFNNLGDSISKFGSDSLNGFK